MIKSEISSDFNCITRVSELQSISCWYVNFTYDSVAGTVSSYAYRCQLYLLWATNFAYLFAISLITWQHPLRQNDAKWRHRHVKHRAVIICVYWLVCKVSCRWHCRLASPTSAYVACLNAHWQCAIDADHKISAAGEEHYLLPANTFLHCALSRHWTIVKVGQVVCDITNHPDSCHVIFNCLRTMGAVGRYAVICDNIAYSHWHRIHHTFSWLIILSLPLSYNNTRRHYNLAKSTGLVSHLL